MPLPEVGHVVVLRADTYDQIAEILEEERQRQIIAKIAIRNAGLRLLDPE